MLKVFICEDSKDERDSFARIIQNVIMIEDYDMAIEMKTGNPDDVLTHIKNSPDINGLYFLDVELGGAINGIELAGKIRDYDPTGYIIIVTAHSSKMPLVFEYKIAPLDFIHKSDLFNIRTRIEDCVRIAHKRYLTHAKESHKSMTIKQDGQIIAVEYAHIISIETSPNQNDNRLILCTGESRFAFYGYIKNVIKQLDSRFIQLNRSCIINTQHMKSFNTSNRDILMSNGSIFTAPLKKMKEIRKFLSHTAL